MNTSNLKKNHIFSVKLGCYLTIIFAFILFSACDRDKQVLSIVIKDENCVEVTGETIEVSINTVHETLVDVIFNGSLPKYTRQIDQGDIEHLNESKDYELITHGATISEEFEKVIITTSFSDTLMQVGSIVKISVRINTDMVKSVFYKVTD